MGAQIDIYCKFNYEHGKPQLKERTKNRLIEMDNLGMVEIGNASYGVEGIMSGLYIEKVWSYSEENWKSYMDWVKEIIDEKTKK